VKPAPRPCSPKTAAVLCLLALGLASCNARFQRFALLDADGRGVALRETPGKPTDREGILEPARGDRVGPYYGLARPVTVGGDAALALRYRSTLDSCRLIVYAEKKKVLAEASLPPAETFPVRFLVPLHSGDVIRGFALSTESDSGKLELTGVSVVAMKRGFSLADGDFRLDASVRSLRAPSLAPPLSSCTVELSDEAEASLKDGAWLFRLSQAVPPQGGGSGILEFRDADGTRSRKFSVRSEGRAVDWSFTQAGIGFLPRTVSFSSRTAGWGLTGLDLATLEDGAPLPADPGQVLYADRKLWRNRDFELYSWDRFPDFLIMDAADYDVLDRTFNRLAFYVEKAGYAGRILENGDLQGLHAYNAHDYRSEDLARFFAAVETQGVKLNRLEEELRRTLERSGIIVRQGAGYTAGKGGILAISRVGGDALRELLLTHESFHGVFFSLEEYREACQKQWEALSPVETRIWKAFLGSKNYNTEDRYLMVNEFQAYLFQQEESKVAGYQATTLARLRAAAPALAGDIAEVAAMKPASFLASFRSLDGTLRALDGLPGGIVILVRPLG